MAWSRLGAPVLGEAAAAGDARSFSWRSSGPGPDTSSRRVDVEGALERLALAAAVSPGERELRGELARTRSRRSLPHRLMQLTAA